MASALVLNLLIFGTIEAKGGVDDDPSTGGLFSLYAVVMVGFVQAMNKQLSFALGFGLTRGVYLLGCAVFAIGLSFASAVVLYALYGIERATGGWGIDLDFFGVYGLGGGNPVLAVLMYAAPMAALITAGTLFGGINSRWGTFGIYVAGLVGLVIAGAFAVAVTYAEAWTRIGHWFAGQPDAALFGGYPWLVAIVLGGATFAIVRRVND